MNEFIIWDERYRVFRKLLKIDFQLGLYFCIDTVVPFEKGELVKNIGLKDINGKSIYADSSIVEFEFGTISNKKLKGYFKYSNYTVGYHIILVDDGNRGRAFRFDTELMYDIKIIDTIQENKLGLIKA